MFDDVVALPNPKETQFNIIATLFNHSIELAVVFLISVIIALYLTGRNAFFSLIIALSATALAAAYFIFSTLTLVKY